MGKSNGNSWLDFVKKAFRSPDDKSDSRRRSESIDRDLGEVKKSGKRRWIFRKHYPSETTIHRDTAKSSGNRDEHLSDQKRAIAVAMATAAAAEAAVATAQAAMEIIRLTTPHSLSIKRHKAVLIIQARFRGYLARKALVALKGIVKLQALIRGDLVRKRAMPTLHCIQSLVRVQSQVCDQRRRRSCESLSLNIARNSIMSDSSSNYDDHLSKIEEIQALIQKAKQCSLTHALSNQTWRMDNDQPDEVARGKRWAVRKIRKDRNLINEDRCAHSMINGIELPKTPSSSKTRIQNQSAEMPTWRSIQFHRMSTGDQPNYMAATASTMARVRSHSTPRRRLSSPIREQTGSSTKKRLSFPAFDAVSNEQRYDVPYYCTE